MDALGFLDLRKAPTVQSTYVVAGDERFLRRLAIRRLAQIVLGDQEPDMARSTYEGETAELATIRDELDTVPFFGGRRFVVVNDADPFVTRYREPLERVFKRTGGGVLVLDVKSWAASTRLAKMLTDDATIQCTLPKNRQAQTLRTWLPKWAKEEHGKTLEPDAIGLLLDLVGFDMGLLDQELAKLAVYVGDLPTIKATDVDKLVGHNREQTAWQMLDAAAEGNRAKALGVLGQLLDQGEEPLGILGAVGWQVRKLAQTARLKGEGLSTAAAMARAGLQPFAQPRVEQHLRRLGPRAATLFDWLLEADLAMKSSGQLPSKVVLERLVVKLAE